MDLTGNRLKLLTQEITEKRFSTLPKNSLTQGLWKQLIKLSPVNSKNKTKQNLKKKHSYRNCWNFAKLELRNQIPTCSTFM